MTELVIRGGRLVDESSDRRADVRMESGVIVEIGEGLRGRVELDATDCIVSSGLVDVHTHLREPGMEDAETIETGARAAALGGFTAVVAMPNTDPAADNAAVIELVLKLGADVACTVHPAGAITVQRAGEHLAPLGEMYDLGVRVFTDDGSCVGDPRVMRRALEYARSLPGSVLMQHAEDPSLVRGGHMHEGAWSARLGIPGRPSIAESIVIHRDAELMRLTGGTVHIQHVSAAESVEELRWAKQRGIAITAEVTPHHFTLTDACCQGYDPVFKVNPPLRAEADVAAIRAALADGTIDCIATDHAPHPVHEKERPFDEAPSGMLGLETALALTLSELVAPGVIDLRRALALLSWNPARIARLHPEHGGEHGGPIAVGAAANLCVIDPAAAWTVRGSALASLARNTPFEGRTLTGRVRHTIVRGEAVVVDGEARR